MTFLFAFLAGALSIFSPCVLPLVPIVFGSAASQGRRGPLALAAGLVISFVVVALFISVVGFSIGLNGHFFRNVAAVLMIAVGAFMAVPQLQRQFAVSAGSFSGWATERSAAIDGNGISGQFLIGLLLGAVWSPCVGPTLGAASILAAKGQNLPMVALTLLMFGLGVATPLILLGSLSREALQKWRTGMLSAGSYLKSTLGIVLILSGLLVLSGLDKRFETVAVELSPAWLTELTTRF